MRKKPTRERAIELLKKYEVPKQCVEHCLQVEKNALVIADQLIGRGVKIDREFVSVAALLHDIGRYKICDERGVPRELGGLHAPEGQLLLEELGFSELAAIAGGHFLLDVSGEEAELLKWPVATKLPDTLEAKIICMADKLRGKGGASEEIQKIFDREDLKERYWNYAPGLKEKLIRAHKRILKELKDLGWDGRV